MKWWMVSKVSQVVILHVKHHLFFSPSFFISIPRVLYKYYIKTNLPFIQIVSFSGLVYLAMFIAGKMQMFDERGVCIISIYNFYVFSQPGEKKRKRD